MKQYLGFIKSFLLRRKILKLKHVIREFGDGSMVLVLNTGAIIGAESEAMLQAMHSRSLGGIRKHLKIIAEKGPEKFMEKFYVGYSHKSIGDCGTGTIFIEGVSLLVAKAIQDWLLYSGQESSTRYVDYTEQRIIDPIGGFKSDKILEEWRSFYLRSQKPVIEHLKKRFPRDDNESKILYEKAIKARSFDILRGFLPAGVSTDLSWHSNLRQTADKLMLLRHHPLAEVREVAENIQSAIIEMYPSSFSHKKYKKTEEYNKFFMFSRNYFNSNCPVDFKLTRNGVDVELLSESRIFLENRPSKTELPKYLAECGDVQFEFLLDFGSFRDIQRHRAVTQRMPLLTTKYDFNEWYLSELPEGVLKKAQSLIDRQKRAISNLRTTPEIEQYYIAIGYNTTNRLTGDLPALVYLVELRATRFVHPTLRKIAIQMADELKSKFGRFGLRFHLDDEPNRFDVNRGKHDIVMK